MDEIMKTETDLSELHQMSEENRIEQEVEECVALKTKVKESVEQVRSEYDHFKEKLNAQVASS